MGGQSAFGSKAGDLFTRITIIMATVWILLCVGAIKVLNTTDTVLGTGDEAAFSSVLIRMLSHEDRRVKDAAAVGLGLLGNDAGQERIEEILNRSPPEQRNLRRSAARLREDAEHAVRILQARPAQACIGQVQIPQIRTLEIGPPEAGIVQLRAKQIRILQVCFIKDHRREIGVFEVGVLKIGGTQVSSAQIHRAQVATTALAGA